VILIKGDAVAFETDEGKIVRLPRRYGIIHDPSGKQLPRCETYFGPYRTVGGHIEMTREAKHYFGRSYRPRKVVVDRPKGPWNPVANVVKIFYVRKGAIAPGGFHHSFRGAPLELAKSGKFYRLSLGNGCIVDDRGFVFP
jgi:hypothetical protein